jgi:hypothetical protein
MNQLIGHISDFHLLKELLTPTVCENMAKLKDKLTPRHLLVNIDLLSAPDVRHLPLFKIYID